MAIFAGVERGTRRSFPPFPLIKSISGFPRTDITGKETSSDTLIPVAYKTCIKQVFRFLSLGERPIWVDVSKSLLISFSER